MQTRLLLYLLPLLHIFFAMPVFAASTPRYIPKHRPAAGIGILTINKSVTESQDSIHLYEEPGLMRTATINPADAPPFEHIFGSYSTTRYLIVTARKQQWLKIIYDDAGREGWLKQNSGAEFKHYSEWLRQPVVRLLPALQKKYYQLYRTENGALTTTLTAKQSFKILTVHNSWARILTEQNQLGWLLWKDEDGRLLIGLAATARGRTP